MTERRTEPRRPAVCLAAALLALACCGPVAAAPAAKAPAAKDAKVASPTTTGWPPLQRKVERISRAEARERMARERRFLAERDRRRQLLDDLRRQLAAARKEGDRLRKQFDANEKALAGLHRTLRQRTGNLGELFGTLRQAAGDLAGRLRESPVSLQYPRRAAWVAGLAREDRLPDIDALERLWHEMAREIREDGRIRRLTLAVTEPDGSRVQRPVIRIGLFTLISGDHYLQYAPEDHRLFDLARQPGRHDRRLAAAFTALHEGTGWMAVDPTRGNLLALLVQRPTLAERIRQGGTVGALIIAVGLGGLLLALYRLLALARTGRRVLKQLRQPEAPDRDNPLGRVLLAAAAAAGDDPDGMERTLDEAILREMPALQRGIGLLKLLAGVAPLLGLLGTVTGMILTFQAITLFGSSEPRLMAGGISQALVTTVMGLVVAIPLLFLHSLVNARSRNLVRILDEEAAALLAGGRQDHAG